MESARKKGNRLVPFLVLNNFLFVSLYCFLLLFNRYAADDYFELWSSQTRGVRNTMLYFFQNWTSKPSAITLSVFSLGKFPEHTVLIGTGLGVYIFLLTALFLLCKRAAISASINLTNKWNALFSMQFCCAFFFTSVSIGETWFWVCSVHAYLLSLVIFLWGLVFLFNGKKNSATYLGLSLCFIYVMGAAESFAVFVVFLCLLALLAVLLIPEKIRQLAEVKHILPKLTAITLLSITCLLVISNLPGTRIRKNFLQQAGFFQTLYLPARTMLYLALKKLPARLLLLILFALPFSLPGSRLKNSPFAENLFGTKSIFATVCLTGVLIYFSLMPACYLMADRGPERSFTVISFMLVLLFVYLAFALGYKKEGLLLARLRTASLLCSSAVLLVYFVQQTQIAPAYSKALSSRIASVTEENKKGRTTVMDLPPLPPSGYYYSAELSSDTTFYNNLFFKRRFGLKFNCRVPKSNDEGKN